MLVGSNTSHLLRVITSASSDIEVTASVIAVSTATPPVVDGSALVPVVIASITTNTTTTIVTGAASTIKRVMEMTLRNNHASTSNDITITREDGTNTNSVVKVTLLAGEWLTYNGAGSWLHYDSNGGLYPSVGNAATQAEMEAGTATNKYVTPQGVNWHPGVAKAWGKHANSGAVPQMTATWNVTSVTDSAPCRATPVIATDFSSANYSIAAMVEPATTTYSATTTSLITVIRNATPAAGTFTIDILEIDIGQATDPAAWYWAAWGDQ